MHYNISMSLYTNTVKAFDNLCSLLSIYPCYFSSIGSPRLECESQISYDFVRFKLRPNCIFLAVVRYLISNQCFFNIQSLHCSKNIGNGWKTWNIRSISVTCAQSRHGFMVTAISAYCLLPSCSWNVFARIHMSLLRQRNSGNGERWIRLMYPYLSDLSSALLGCIHQY